MRLLAALSCAAGKTVALATGERRRACAAARGRGRGTGQGTGVLSHVPFEVVGEQTQEDVGADAVLVQS